jgi:peptide/nickel transport system substrate-binding protein
MKGGEVDYASRGLTDRQFNDLASAGFPVIHGETPDILRADLSVDVAPLTSVELRQAIAYAVPYDSIIKTVFSGRATRATSIVNPKAPQVDPAWGVYTTDLAKAKSLLKKSGAPSTFVLDIWYGTGVGYYEDVARLIAASLNSAGIKTKLQPKPALQLTDLTNARIDKKPDSTMSGMYISGGVIWLDDPDTTIDLWGKSTGIANWARYNNPEVDQLHAQFRDSTDVAARTAAYKKIQEDMASDVGALPVAVLGRTVATNPNIVGVTYTPDPYARYEYLKPKA